MKNALSVVLAFIFVFSACVIVTGAEEKFDYNYEVTVTAVNRKVNSGEVIVATNDTTSPKKIKTVDYGLSKANIMIFNSDGLIIEAGGDLMPSTDGVYGSCQTFITIPPKGFAVLFSTTTNSNISKLNTVKTQAMENAMLYNATMTIDREIYASFDQKNMKLKLWYNKAPAVSDAAKRVLFVGNSSTYFNGTPIKFRALCRAAGIEVKVDYCTFGSAYLYEFADETHERGKAYRSKLKNNKYDYIVFQGAAGESFEISSPALDVLIPLAKANGAEPVLYMRYSAAETFEQMRANGEKHYKNYTKLGERYNCLVSPLAVAYIYAYRDYPEINLYAEDMGHHSPEGSYLIACSLMYTIFGKSPVGNTYTAYLDETTVKHLQECAALAEETEYIPVTYNANNTYTENGKTYKNIAEGKKYTATGAIYSSDTWFDIKDGNCVYKFTNGDVAASGSDGQCGCYKGSSQSITIDLEKVYEIKKIWNDMYGNDGWGIKSPKNAAVKIYVSENGKDFTLAGQSEMTKFDGSSWETAEFELVLAETVKARYVRFDFTISGNFLWLSELRVFGEEAAERGDLDGDGEVNTADAIYLLRHTMRPDRYPLAQSGDVNGDGQVNTADAIYLLRHTMRADRYPLA